MAETFSNTPSVNLITLQYAQTAITSVSISSVEIDAQPLTVVLTGTDLNAVTAVYMNGISLAFTNPNPTTLNVTLDNVGIGTFPFHIDIAGDDFDTSQTVNIYQSKYSRATTISKSLRYGKFYGLKSKSLKYSSK